MRVNCPMCGGRAAVVTSSETTPTLRHAYVQCRNAACGWTGTAYLAVDRTINPGLRPRADIHLEIPAGATDAFVRALLRLSGPERQP